MIKKGGRQFSKILNRECISIDLFLIKFAYMSFEIIFFSKFKSIGIVIKYFGRIV
jgi:hypothetical protein